MISHNPAPELPYTRGDYFALPLRNGCGYAVGIATHMDGTGGVIGYFFGPALNRVPSLQETKGKKASDAVFIANFGDLGLIEGTWRVIGPEPGWNPADWPMPVFERKDLITGEVSYITYRDESLFNEIPVPAPLPRPAVMPKARISGAGAVEIVLTKLLCG